MPFSSWCRYARKNPPQLAALQRWQTPWQLACKNLFLRKLPIAEDVGWFSKFRYTCEHVRDDPYIKQINNIAQMRWFAYKVHFNGFALALALFTSLNSACKCHILYLRQRIHATPVGRGCCRLVNFRNFA